MEHESSRIVLTREKSPFTCFLMVVGRVRVGLNPTLTLPTTIKKHGVNPLGVRRGLFDELLKSSGRFIPCLLQLEAYQIPFLIFATARRMACLRVLGVGIEGMTIIEDLGTIGGLVYGQLPGQRY